MFSYLEPKLNSKAIWKMIAMLIPCGKNPLFVPGVLTERFQKCFSVRYGIKLKTSELEVQRITELETYIYLYFIKHFLPNRVCPAFNSSYHIINYRYISIGVRQ